MNGTDLIDSRGNVATIAKTQIYFKLFYKNKIVLERYKFY